MQRSLAGELLDAAVQDSLRVKNVKIWTTWMSYFDFQLMSASTLSYIRCDLMCVYMSHTIQVFV